MDDFTRLSRPDQSQIKIDPAPKDCPSDGFNYPSFRLINKQGRVRLSSDSLNPQPTISYRLLAVANSKGWFAAVTSSAIIFSLLDELHSAFKSAKEENEETFTPKRTLTVPGTPTIIALACNDTRLFIGLQHGPLLVYDTAVLFSPGSDNINPLHALESRTGPIIQILPNPGTEPNLLDMVAVVRSERSVQLFNMQLESQGGWVGVDSESAPVAVAWSPKGKHIAIGLRSGDILTFSTTNKTTPHKHIPPTAAAPLISLTWLSPGHTFRTSYAPPAPNASDPTHHIISLDIKSSTATYVAPTHPYPIPDRLSQQAFTIALPRWDEDSSTADSKSLLVVGDKSSVDLEILGNTGSQWYQQSQENPLTLPLDKSMDDTILLSLEVDLTDSSTGAPIMYAYLNDGTLQGWHMEHTKPYLGMVTAQTVTAAPVTAFSQPSAPFGQAPPTSPQLSAFGQPSLPSAFGTSSVFGQSTFGQPSAFGKQPSAFGQPSTSAFGTSGFGTSQLNTAPTFGQAQSSPELGSSNKSSAFGAPSASPSPFGQPVFGQSSQPVSAFASNAPAASPFGGGSVFGGGSSGAFGTTTASPFGGSSAPTGAFGSFSPASGASNVFGQPGFGFASSPASTSSATPAPEISREASMSEAAPSFGGLSLGLGEDNTDSSKLTKPGIFGSLPSPPPPPSASSSFEGIIKPAAGFGAFGSLQTTPSTISSNSQVKPSTEQPSAFGAAATQPSSAFGQSSFGQSSFGKPAFGQSAFGQSSFPKPAIPATTTSTSGGFGAFASAAPATFAGALQQAKTEGSSESSSTPATSTASGGFGAFSGAATPFGSISNAASTPEKPKTPFGAGATFGSTLSGDINQPAFRENALLAKPTPIAKTPATIFSPSSSPDSSPPPKPTLVAENESPPAPSPFRAGSSAPNSGAFGNLTTTPSAFKPATGFGAFGSDTTPTSSPFFKVAETKTPPSAISAFSKPASNTPASPSPAFGSTSMIGGFKSAFVPSSPTPTKTPTTGGFSAFSGSSAGFGAFSGPKKSFGELLRSGDADTTDPVKPKTTIPDATALTEEVKRSGDNDNKAEDKNSAPISIKSEPDAESEVKASDPSPEPLSTDDGSKEPVSVSRRGSPSAQDNKMLKKEGSSATIPDDSDLSLSGTGSFVEISNEGELAGELTPSDDEDGNEDEQQPESDNQSFLSDSEGPHDEDFSDDHVSDQDQLSEPPDSPEATNVPLPASRSPSATPQPEVPAIRFTPSPSPSESSSSPGSVLSTIREESTTPPGTPTKEPSSYFSEATPPARTPAGSTTSTPFGLGIGRPSTRPTRSSPLASAPVLHEDEDEDGDHLNVAPVTSQKPPVSPRPQFSVLPLPPESPTKPESEPGKAKTPKMATRPLTPPLSMLGTTKPISNANPSAIMPGPMAPSQQPASNSEALPTAARSPAPSPSPFGSMKPFPSATLPSTPPAPPTFGFLSGTPPPLSTPPGSSGTGFNLGAFNSKTPQSSTPTSLPASLFGNTPPATASPTAFKLGALTQTPPQVVNPPPEATMEEGMQKECALLFTSLNRELEELRLLAQEASKKRAELGKSTGGSRRKADLGDTPKWGLGDIVQFGQVLQRYQQDLVDLKALRDKQSHDLRSLQTNMLKARTRREEISRFNKAKDDHEFAKMLKARTLGPEHLETQTQLRRNIRAMRDRIQKLEEHLKASKKKLAQVKAGKPGLRAPSLDTINRTYRNIDIAIGQQAADVAKLTSRISKLNLTTSLQMVPSRDPRLPDPASRRPYNVTPHVAITTAAALNAERSAHKLKRALLSIRNEPLLNKQAAVAPAPPGAFKTPQKIASASDSDFGFKTPIGSLFTKPPESTLPDWTLPEDNFNPSPPPSARRGAGAAPKKHQSVPLKRTTPGVTASPPASTFDWGPLPTFNHTPATSMVEAIKLTPPKPAVGNAPPNFFSGFGKKT